MLNCCFFPAAAAADDDGKDSGKDAADSDAIIVIASDRDNGMGWDGMRCDRMEGGRGEVQNQTYPPKEKKSPFQLL